MKTSQQTEDSEKLRLSYTIVLAVTLSWIPAQCIWYLIRAIYPGPSVEWPFLEDPLRAVTTFLVIAPVLETYGMRMLFSLLGRFIKNERKLNIASALIWGTMHWETESWGLHACWAFYVMGKWYLRLRAQSLQLALYTTMGIHALFNTLSYVLYLLQTR